MLNDKLQPHKISDLVDNIDLYLDEMRLKKDLIEIPKHLKDYAWSYFRDIDLSKDKLKTMAIFHTDHIYRYAADLKILDEYTKIYFTTVYTYIFDYLQTRGIDVFYILDNMIRDDRFNLTILLYALSGFAVVVPYNVKGKYLQYMSIEEQALWVLNFNTQDFKPEIFTITIDSPINQLSEIDDLIDKYQKHKRNIIYIEKDDSVNYIDLVVKKAENSSYLAFLRNLEPTNTNVRLLTK